MTVDPNNFYMVETREGAYAELGRDLPKKRWKKDEIKEITEPMIKFCDRVEVLK